MQTHFIFFSFTFFFELNIRNNIGIYFDKSPCKIFFIFLLNISAFQGIIIFTWIPHVLKMKSSYRFIELILDSIKYISLQSNIIEMLNVSTGNNKSIWVMLVMLVVYLNILWRKMSNTQIIGYLTVIRWRLLRKSWEKNGGSFAK